MKKFLLALLVPAVFATGCSSGGSTFDIQVSPTKELEKVYGYYPSIEVDIIGASDEDAMRLKPYPIEKYFEKDNPVRTYLNPVKFKFSESDLSNKVLHSSDPLFKEWVDSDISYIVMIANLPYSDPEMKENDPRKYVYKVPKGFFSMSPDIYVKIGATGLVRTTMEGARAERPEAPKSTDELPKTLDLKCVSEKGKSTMECKEKKEPLPGGVEQ